MGRRLGRKSALIVSQDKVQERLDALDRTREADERRFKKHDVPWNRETMTEVRHAFLVLMERYLRDALDEARAIMASKLPLKMRREQALCILRGAALCRPERCVGLVWSPSLMHRGKRWGVRLALCVTLLEL